MDSIINNIDVDYGSVKVTYQGAVNICTSCDGAGGHWDAGDIWHQCDACKGSGYTPGHSLESLPYDTSTCDPGWFVLEINSPEPDPNIQVGEDGHVYVQFITGGMHKIEEEDEDA